MRRLAAAAVICMLIGMGAVAGAYESEHVADGGEITGIVKYEGRPPKPQALEISKDLDVCGRHPAYDQSLIVGNTGGIANAVVTITDISKGEAPRPQAEVKFDQKGCEYVPHVAAFTAGSTVAIINSDGILHNIHTESTINPVIDIAQPGFKKVIKVRVAKPEAIKVSCDAHNWMEGWWYVTGNPYYAVTDASGRFTIKNVPPGTYPLQVWQEKLGTMSQKVTVKPGASITVGFTMKPKSS
jgi:hypothetical protein